MTTQPPSLDFSKIAAAADAAQLPAAPKPVPKVMIAVASADWKMEVHTSESIRLLCSACRCETQVRFMFNDGVARSRNNLAAMFLESDCNLLFFLDSDIIIEPSQFQRMLDVIFKFHIVAAPYPKKQGTLDWVANYLANESPDEEGFLSVRHMGTGALLIERVVMEDFVQKHPERAYSGDPSPAAKRVDFFPMRAVDGSYKSEDWDWCETVLADGWKIYMDTKSQLRHVGKCVYPLQFTLTDDEVIDIVYHRYKIWPDHVKSFIASGGTPPGLMGGHRMRGVRLWPKDFPVSDLYGGGVIAGAFEVPLPDNMPAAPVIVDIGADYGAFARFAEKRWPGATIESIEYRADVFVFLERTIAQIKDAKATAKLTPVENITPELIIACNLLKIDLPGSERTILSALQAASRLAGIDAVVITYDNDTEAFLVSKLMEATHLLHCWQRLADGRGIVKFINRNSELGVRLLRSA
jgi:hypothetical protein